MKQRIPLGKSSFELLRTMAGSSCVQSKLSYDQADVFETCCSRNSDRISQSADGRSRKHQKETQNTQLTTKHPKEKANTQLTTTPPSGTQAPDADIPVGRRKSLSNTKTGWHGHEVRQLMQEDRSVSQRHPPGNAPFRPEANG
jgi:hypothetical protein